MGYSESGLICGVVASISVISFSFMGTGVMEGGGGGGKCGSGEESELEREWGREEGAEDSLWPKRAVRKGERPL